MEFPFYDSPNTATIICCHILERQAPILYVSHDEDDGMWQFRDRGKFCVNESNFGTSEQIYTKIPVVSQFYAEKHMNNFQFVEL